MNRDRLYKMSGLLLERRYWLLYIAIIIILVFYCINLTYSPLWYDESIEYWYSKVVNGPVPGGFNTNNMYERIVYTFQPPLYNVLMHFWLLLFDFEAGYRFAGVLATIIGACGIYFSLYKLSNDLWAFFGMLFFAFIPSVNYYALECGEYNLLICMISWLIYFYVKLIKEDTVKKFDLIGFLIFASLSVYSQYGACFIILPMCVVLLFHRRKRPKELLKLVLGGALTFLILGIPLILAFFIPQVKHQGTTSISHMLMPVHGSILLDYAAGMKRTFLWVLKAGWSGLSEQVQLGMIEIIGILLLFSLVSLILKNRYYYSLMVCFILSTVLYYFMVACSFYGYNDWDGTLGSANMGGRYCLFFTPLFTVCLCFGLFLACEHFSSLFKEKAYSNTLIRTLVFGLIFTFCIAGMRSLNVNWKKDDIKDSVYLWYQQNITDIKTVVHEKVAANFQFYVTHNKNYYEDIQSNIIETGYWIREVEYDEMKQKLEEIGILDLDAFFLIGPRSSYSDGHTFLMHVLEDEGYEVTVLKNNISCLLLLEKL